jgi:hypothetical protein
MIAPVELIALRCIRCNTPVPAEPDEVAWVCSNCGQGLLLDETNGLSAVEIHFASRIPSNTKGRPFWIVDGQVDLQREAYGTFGKKTGQAVRFWEHGRRFFVPAFRCPLDTLLDLGTALLQNPPDLGPGPDVPFEPVVLGPEDLPALAEFIVMAIEAARRDQVKSLKLAVRLSDPALWILP